MCEGSVWGVRVCEGSVRVCKRIKIRNKVDVCVCACVHVVCVHVYGVSVCVWCMHACKVRATLTCSFSNMSAFLNIFMA